VAASLDVADAHPHGASPWGATEYITKFRQLAQGTVPAHEQDRFLDLAGKLGDVPDGPGLSSTEVRELSFEVPGLCAEIEQLDHDDGGGGLF
jgi:hypothetical protein